MQVLISERRVLTALHRVGIIADLFASRHKFYVSDIALEGFDLDRDLLSNLLALGLAVEELTPGELAEAARLKRAHLAICSGDASTMALALSRNWPVIVGNRGLGTLMSDGVRIDISWILSELEGKVPPSTLKAGFENILKNDGLDLFCSALVRKLADLETSA